MSGVSRATAVKVALVCLALAGCDCAGVMVGGHDAGAPDAAEVDGGVSPHGDAGFFDGGLNVDAGVPDAGPDDGGVLDAGAGADAGFDAGLSDGGLGDDGGSPLDAGEVDGGLEDGGVVTLTCTSCHGSLANAAPPRDTQGGTARASRTVGAHQEHLAVKSWHRNVQCTDCHRVPATIEEPGHLDAPPAELTFGAVPNAGNVTSQFNGNTCNTYCHGVTLTGGTLLDPDWATGPTITCGRCHGNPPPPPHPSATPYLCNTCHIDIFFTQGDRHIDGQLDLTVDCKTCHGDTTSPAPPRDTTGNTSTSARGVGAHRSHLGPSAWHAEVTCDDCHTVPTRADDPGHLGLLPAEVNFGASAQARGAQPTWDGARCSTYCHGQTLDAGAGTNTTPMWNVVNGSQAACGTCHGRPPGGTHPNNPQCSTCHGAVIAPDGGFLDPSLHINGLVEAQVACGSCHGLPPATGTHLVHTGLLGSRLYGNLSTAASTGSTTGYAFGCGQCHPMDPARHLNGGRAEVELYSPTAPPGSLKARSPLAAYTPGPSVFSDDAGLPYTLGTCTTYCHSGAAITTPNPVPRPGLDFTFAGYPVSYPAYAVDVARTLRPVVWGSAGTGCGACHDYPVRTAEPTTHAGVGQSHSFLGPTGLESGHAFNHNDAPLSCRVCHRDTVTAANSTTRVAGLSAYGPVPITGYFAHVNGLPDVAFDTANPVTSAGRSFTLAGATYSQSQHTCSSVACHKSQSAVPNGHPFRPDQVNVECNVCHQY
ncbi:MAG: hypothetical protein JNJ54_20380 [Myxococcaceae bacterium]|nr:hypothetical protein [Myxococcaceae bacterium]